MLLTDFFSPTRGKGKAKAPGTRIFEITKHELPLPAKRRRSAQNDSSQRILDAGQREIGLTTCAQCGMAYSVDDQNDLAEHKRHHDIYSDTTRFAVPASNINKWKKDTFRHNSSNDGVMFCIRRDSKSSLKRQVDSLVEEVVNREVGFCHDLSVWGPYSASRLACVYVRETTAGFKIVAIGMFDRIREAVWEQSGETCISSEDMLGVNRIWVHPTARRKGYAERLLDWSRTILIVGGVVPRDRVVFSEPTDSGKALARKYARLDTGDFLVYRLKKE